MASARNQGKPLEAAAGAAVAVVSLAAGVVAAVVLAAPSSSAEAHLHYQVAVAASPWGRHQAGPHSDWADAYSQGYWLALLLALDHEDP